MSDTYMSMNGKELYDEPYDIETGEPIIPEDGFKVEPIMTSIIRTLHQKGYITRCHFLGNVCYGYVAHTEHGIEDHSNEYGYTTTTIVFESPDIAMIPSLPPNSFWKRSDINNIISIYLQSSFFKDAFDPHNFDFYTYYSRILMYLQELDLFIQKNWPDYKDLVFMNAEPSKLMS